MSASSTPPKGKDLGSFLKRKGIEPDTLQLKDFQVSLQIGQGAFALVKRATHKRSNCTVAIKSYDKKNLQDKSNSEAVKREVYILKHLDHPNIMHLYSVIDNRQSLNLVTELCLGKSLYHHIKKKPEQKLPEKECKIIFKQLTDAVAYLHERNVAHRDLKLDNVLLDEKKQIKLIDFGFSVCINEESKLSLYCGTPHYMDPDIVKKKDYNGKAADVWALGVILFILMTGKLPFFGEFEGDLFRKIQKAKYDIPKTVSNEGKALIRRIFNTDSLSRVSAREILRDEWLRGVPTPMCA